MPTDIYSVQVNSTDSNPTFVFPANVVTAAVDVIGTASYTVTNSKSNTPGVTYTNGTNFPENINLEVYNVHVITVLSGIVQISYILRS